MNVYVLMGHGYGESWLIGLFSTRKDAWRKALQLRWDRCEQDRDGIHLIGKRERFDDGSLGVWWSDMYRKNRDTYTVDEESLQGVA